MSIPETIALIILQIIMAVSYITIIYFTFVKNIERNIIKEQIKSAIEQLKEIYLINDTYSSPQLTYKPTESDIQSENDTEQNNYELYTKSIEILKIICLVGIILVGIMVFSFKLDVKRLIFLSLLGTIVIAITELFFVLIFIQNYIIVDPNMVENSIVKGMLNYIQ